MKQKKMTYSASPKLEFYSRIHIIKDMYENQGYKKLTELFRVMQDKYGWKMEYSSFTRYFNIEIKNKKEALTPALVPQKPEKKIPITPQTKIEFGQEQKRETSSEELLSTMTPERQIELRARLEDSIKRNEEMEEFKKQFAKKQNNKELK